LAETRQLPDEGSPEREHVIRRMLSDTGFFARFVLGMDTDRDEYGNAFSDVGKGGIRDTGPHQEVIEFLDDESSNHRMLWAPRAAYKSSMLRAYIMRKIVAHPNISILIYWETDDIAKRRLLEIREELERNPILRELFPNMRGRLWKQDQFITGLRTDKASDSPTLFAGSPRKIPVGARPNEIIWDDIVTENDLGELALQRGRRCVERSLPLGAKGCRHTFVGTPKHFADAGHWLLELPGWKKLVHLDVGFDIKVNDDKSLSLAGTGRWPHLNRERIEPLLRGGVSFPTFMSEYKLQVVSGSHQRFHRHQFQPINLGERMRDLTGYLLTDIAQGTAPGAISKERSNGALNVLLYVGVDERNRVYMLDCEVGRWQMLEFCERYLNMLERWSAKVNHRVEVWEQVHSNTAYAQFLAIKAKERGRRASIAWQQRNVSEPSKDARINATQVRFQAMEVFVSSTMPRTWNDETTVRTLWDPDGYTDVVKGLKLPGGDLVEQFIRHPHHPLKDIPDAFALIDSVDRETGERVCFWMRPSRLAVSPDQARAPISNQQRRGASDRFYGRLRNRRRA
jgi:hypothetical protein